MNSSVARQISRLVDQISTVIVGKRSQIEDCVACLLAGGHLLIEDVGFIRVGNYNPRATASRLAATECA